MIDHGRALTLAATAIDFPLDSGERGTLEEHLRGCAECRTALGGFRRDAARLGALPPIAPPAWVQGSIGRTRRSNPYVLLAAAAFLIVAAGLAIVAGTTLVQDRTALVVPSSGPGPSLSVVPSLTPGPSLTPEPAATLIAIDPLTARWTAIGSGSGGALVGFDGGYVVLGIGDQEAPITQFSIDGVTWEPAQLANPVRNCPGFGPPGDEDVPDADATVIATNGRQVVVVGAQSPHDPIACAAGGSIRPIAWISDNGRTWRRSAPFYTAGQNGRARAVWPVSDGWQAIAEDPQLGSLTLWQSIDGLDWQMAGSPAVDLFDVPGAAASAGQVVLAVVTGLPGEGVTSLLGSLDGGTWAPIGSASPCTGQAVNIVAPRVPGRGAWLFWNGSQICTSPNLVAWSTTELPIVISSITLTRFGAIALGDTCQGLGNECLDPQPRAYLSVDGVTWLPIEHPNARFAGSVADGPAGVLMLAPGLDASENPVTGAWLLAP